MFVKLISGYDFGHLQKRANWLKPFCTVINRQGIPAMHKDIEEIAPKDVHNIQVRDKAAYMYMCVCVRACLRV